jgi:hypothetical protein
MGEIEPIRVDTEPEFNRDTDYEYEVMKDMAGEHLEEQSFKLVDTLRTTMYYRGSEEKLFRHLVEAIGRNLDLSFKQVDKSFKRIVKEA